MSTTLQIRDVFEISGRGAVLSCDVASGKVAPGMRTESLPLGGSEQGLTVRGVDFVDRLSRRESHLGLTFYDRPSVEALRGALADRSRVRLLPAAPFRRLRVAFDLDDTLLLTGSVAGAEVEAGPALARWLLRGPLRPRTVPLLRSLRASGHDLWIYTTSYRGALRIRLAFASAGIRLGGIVNQRRQEREMGSHSAEGRRCSKYPPAFGVDLLVDDSLGVEAEGREYGFSVCRVAPDDRYWLHTVSCCVGLAAYGGG